MATPLTHSLAIFSLFPHSLSIFLHFFIFSPFFILSPFSLSLSPFPYFLSIVSFSLHFMSFDISCDLSHLVIIVIIDTKVIMALMLKVVIEDRCALKKCFFRIFQITIVKYLSSWFQIIRGRRAQCPSSMPSKSMPWWLFLNQRIGWWAIVMVQSRRPLSTPAYIPKVAHQRFLLYHFHLPNTGCTPMVPVTILTVRISSLNEFWA